MAIKGIKFSNEHRKKLSDAQKRIKTVPPSRKGKKMPEEAIKKLSDRMKGNTYGRCLKGERHHNWKGGISKLPNYRSFIQKRRDLRKIGNGGSHNLGEWINLIAQYNWTCPCCSKKEPEIKLTEDHIVPISKGGSDNIENIQPLCKLCNNKKYMKIIKFAEWDNTGNAQPFNE